MSRLYKYICVIGLLSLSLSVAAQDSLNKSAAKSSTGSYRARSDARPWDVYLPSWCIDVKGRIGWLDQDLTMIPFKEAYNGAYNASNYTPSFSQGISSGGDVQVSWFFSSNKRWGVGLGAMYMQYTGSQMISEKFRVEFPSVDGGNRPFQQIISMNAPLYEDVRISNVNIPILMKYKWTFAKPGEAGGLGLTVEAGPVLGIYNNTHSTATGSFNYEAIYQIDSREGKDYYVTTPDGKLDENFEHLLFTREAITGNDQAAFESLRLHDKSWNVGVNLPIAADQRVQDKDYNQMSFGGMIQAGISYHLSYHVAFNLAGYFMYQRWQNSDNGSYRITDQVVGNAAPYSANYRPMTGAVEKADYMSYGVSAGFRFYFGGKRDLDGDGFEDAIDDCRELAGAYRGCPDTDGDGVPDTEDECPSLPGPQVLAGCPDSDEDGVADKNDHCPYEFGDPKNFGCKSIEETIQKAVAKAIDSTLKSESGERMKPHIVLKTDVLYFDFGKVDLKDSAKDILDYAVAVLNRETNIVIHLNGHSDNIGNDRINQNISFQRAKMASDYLEGKGVPKARIIIEGQGKNEPVAPNDSPKNRALNRRLEMRLLLPLNAETSLEKKQN